MASSKKQPASRNVLKSYLGRDYDEFMKKQQEITDKVAQGYQKKKDRLAEIERQKKQAEIETAQVLKEMRKGEKETKHKKTPEPFSEKVLQGLGKLFVNAVVKPLTFLFVIPMKFIADKIIAPIIGVLLRPFIRPKYDEQPIQNEEIEKKAEQSKENQLININNEKETETEKIRYQQPLELPEQKMFNVVEEFENHQRRNGKIPENTKLEIFVYIMNRFVHNETVTSDIINDALNYATGLNATFDAQGKAINIAFDVDNKQYSLSLPINEKNATHTLLVSEGQIISDEEKDKIINKLTQQCETLIPSVRIIWNNSSVFEGIANECTLSSTSLESIKNAKNRSDKLDKEMIRIQYIETQLSNPEVIKMLNYTFNKFDTTEMNADAIFKLGYLSPVEIIPAMKNPEEYKTIILKTLQYLSSSEIQNFTFCSVDDADILAKAYLVEQKNKPITVVPEQYIKHIDTHINELLENKIVERKLTPQNISSIVSSYNYCQDETAMKIAIAKTNDMLKNPNCNLNDIYYQKVDTYFDPQQVANNIRDIVQGKDAMYLAETCKSHTNPLLKAYIETLSPYEITQVKRHMTSDVLNTYNSVANLLDGKIISVGTSHGDDVLNNDSIPTNTSQNTIIRNMNSENKTIEEDKDISDFGI